MHVQADIMNRIFSMEGYIMAKQMIGKSYEMEDDGSEYIVRCSYVCPYCHESTKDYFTIDKDDEETVDLVRNKAFFEKLECDSCGKTADVRFYASMRY